MSSPFNTARELNFSGPRIGAWFISQPRDYHIGPRSIVVNPNRTDISLDAAPANAILPFSSVTLQNVRVFGDSIIVLELLEARNPGGIVLEQGWNLYAGLVPEGSPFPRDTPLWRSQQDEIGTVRFDPASLPGQGGRKLGMMEFVVKANLWFATEKSDCAIHNQHDFIEIHTQVVGCGRMQKFRDQDFSTLYYDEMMSPGYTTATPFCNVVACNKFVYPWHQYYADTDSVWMAVEFHPAL